MKTMVVYVKGEGRKIVNVNNKAVLDAVIADGWTREGSNAAAEGLDALRAEAEALGLSIHHRAGAERIREAIAEAKAAR